MYIYARQGHSRRYSGNVIEDTAMCLRLRRQKGFADESWRIGMSTKEALMVYGGGLLTLILIVILLIILL